jgi:hypothetical protein
MKDEPTIVPGFESSDRGADPNAPKFERIWKPGQTLSCHCCGKTDRPLRKMYKTLNSSARICDLCFDKYVKWKEMFRGVNDEFDRQLTLPVERRERCTHCGKEMVVTEKYPPMWCWDCEKKRRKIAQEAKSKEEARKYALHN